MGVTLKYQPRPYIKNTLITMWELTQQYHFIRYTLYIYISTSSSESYCIQYTVYSIQYTSILYNVLLTNKIK